MTKPLKEQIADKHPVSQQTVKVVIEELVLPYLQDMVEYYSAPEDKEQDDRTREEKLADKRTKRTLQELKE